MLFALSPLVSGSQNNLLELLIIVVVIAALRAVVVHFTSCSYRNLRWYHSEAS